jgi:hypothetical protein
VPTLFVKCKTCATDFPSPIGETETGHLGLIISGLRLHCPKCGADDQFSTADFHMPMPSDGPGAAPSATAVEDIHHEHAAKQEAVQAKLAGLAIVPPEGRRPDPLSE